MKKNISTSKGYTLIELLIAICIMGIISAIILVTLNSSRMKSRDAKRISDVVSISSALQQYYGICHQYPISTGGGTIPTGLATSTNNGCPTSVSFGSFMPVIPTPPSGANVNTYRYWIGNVTSNSISSPQDYILNATLESNIVQLKESSLLNGYANTFETTYNYASRPFACYQNGPNNTGFYDYCISPR